MSQNKDAFYAPVPFLTSNGDVLKVDPDQLKKFLQSEKGMLPSYPQVRAILDKKKPILQQWVEALKDRYKAVLVDSVEAAPARVRLASIATIHRIATVSVPCSDADFWKLVSRIGWGTRTTNPKVVKRALMFEFTAGECQGFESKIIKFHNLLLQAMSKNRVSLGLSLDKVGATVNQAIGLGGKFYLKCLADPVNLLSLASKGAPATNFADCFPSADEFDNLDVGKFSAWAKRLSNELREAFRSDEYRDLWPEVKFLTGYLEIMILGDYREFLKTERSGKAIAESLAEQWSSYQTQSTFRTESTALSNKWAVWNLYDDVNDYLSGDTGGFSLMASNKTANQAVFGTEQFSYDASRRQFTGEASELRLDGWPMVVVLISKKTGSRVLFSKSKVLRDDEELLGVEYVNRDPMINCTVLIFND